jgi:hypothetical protein
MDRAEHNLRGVALSPDDAVLLHIGPHKTGTTTVQMALDQARARLCRQGVAVPAESRHPRSAVLAGTGGNGVPGEPPPDPAAWTELARRTRDGRGRAVLSSEFFTSARPKRIPVIISELGGDRVQIVITLRPLSRILPSQWQQHLQNRMTLTYDEWLEKVFHRPNGRVARRFWNRHDHAGLIDRWASIVGAQRVTVIAPDPGDPADLLRLFDTVLGVTTGTLRMSTPANRSLTLGEAEMLRLINTEAANREWSDEQYAQMVRQRLVQPLAARIPAPDDEPIKTPAWALAAAATRQADAVESIANRGVHVLGDLERLARDEVQPRDPAADPLITVSNLIAGFARRDAPVGSADTASTRDLIRIAAARSARSLAPARRSVGDLVSD